MSVPILQPPERLFVCPNCQHQWHGRAVAAPFHDCDGLNGLTAPLVLCGVDCEVVAVRREDMLSGARQRSVAGIPFMGVETRYADGSNDLAAFPEVIKVKGGR